MGKTARRCLVVSASRRHIRDLRSDARMSERYVFVPIHILTRRRRIPIAGPALLFSDKPMRELFRNYKT
jgi:hypothetical protein